jgi:hypothetical protein
MKTTIFALFILLLNLTSIMSQTVFDVSSLNPYKHYTDKEIRMTLGEPSRYFINEDELGEVREYQYGSKEKYDMFRCQEFAEVLEFVLETSTYFIFNNKIRVGDYVAKFSNIDNGILQKQSQCEYYFYLSKELKEEYLTIKTNSNGVIISISFLPSV